MVLGAFAHRLSVCVFSASIIAGCASAPRLDDAKLKDVSLVSLDDLYGSAKSRWPKVQLTFQSHRPLFEPSGVATFVRFELCDGPRDQRHLYGFGLAEIIPLADESGPMGQPQEYEVVFDYVHWDKNQARTKGDPVVLLPLPSDLCVAIIKPSKPFSPSVGRPLRVRREVVNELIGPFPRPIPAL